MKEILLLLILGLLLGILLREKKPLTSHADRLTLVSTWALLFLLGISLGSQPQVLMQIGKIGLDAVVISTASIVGSILACRALCSRFFEDNTPDA